VTGKAPPTRCRSYGYGACERIECPPRAALPLGHLLRIGRERSAGVRSTMPQGLGLSMLPVSGR
jgi:hypothetical protein